MHLNPEVVLFGLMVICALVLFILRRNKVVVIFDIQKGLVKVVKGRPTQRLLADIRDVIRHAPVEVVETTAARLKIVIESRNRTRPRLLIRGSIDEGTAQQLRNVVGTFHIAELLLPSP